MVQALCNCNMLQEFYTVINGEPKCEIAFLFPVAAGHQRKEDERFTETCLVDAFRSLGVKVPYTKSGPFWAVGDGVDMLSPFG